MNRPEPPDYTYDIPEEDLRRYRKLSPQEILRWLQDINEFQWRISLQNPMVSDDVKKPGGHV
jgi:hypothetical protein